MKCVIGIDLGGTNIKYGIIRSDGTHEKIGSIETRGDLGADHVFEKVISIINGLREKSTDGKNIAAVGIGLPALVDSKAGMLLNAPNLKIKNSPVAKIVSSRSGLPVIIDNDANAMLEGEAWLGAAAGLSNVVLLTLGTGVGGAIMIEGRIARGATGVAAEIGHMVIDINGTKCGCGNYGCFEQYASATALVRIAREILGIHCCETGQSTTLDSSNLTAKGIFEASKTGDKVARYATDQFSEYLGIGISNLVNIFNPEAIILSGGVVKAGAPLFSAVKKVLARHTFKEAARAARIIPAKFGDQGGILGAAKLAMNLINDVK